MHNFHVYFSFLLRWLGFLRLLYQSSHRRHSVLPNVCQLHFRTTKGHRPFLFLCHPLLEHHINDSFNHCCRRCMKSSLLRCTPPPPYKNGIISSGARQCFSHRKPSPRNLVQPLRRVGSSRLRLSNSPPVRSSNPK
jgi:hypothetical protein